MIPPIDGEKNEKPKDQKPMKNYDHDNRKGRNIQALWQLGAL